jgi:hypothetical protein
MFIGIEYRTYKGWLDEIGFVVALPELKEAHTSATTSLKNNALRVTRSFSPGIVKILKLYEPT